MMTYSNSASMQVEVTAYAILVFNEISSRGVSGCQVSNHLKESLLFSLSIEKRDILIILHGFGSLKGTRRCIHINTVTLYPKWKKKTFWEKLYIPPRNKVEISFHCMWKCQEIEYKTRHTRENKSTNILTFFNHFIVIYLFIFRQGIWAREYK